MSGIAYTGIFYLIESLVCFWGSFRYWHNYQETENSLYRLFSRGALGVGISFIVLSLASVPSLQSADSLRLIWYFGIATNYLALAFMLSLAFSARGQNQLGLILGILYIAGVFIFLIGLALQPSQSYVSQGVIVWSIAKPFNIISAILFAAALTPVTTLFLTNREHGKFTFKQFLMGLAFMLSGAGAVTISIVHSVTFAWVAHLTSLLGFFCFALFFAVYPRKEKNSDESIPAF